MGLFDKVKKIFNTDEEENDNNLLNNQTSKPEKEELQLLEPNGYNFTYLDSLIYGGESHIKLDYDVILTDDELGHFTEGIYIGIDNITIDGNGHTIDARGKSRIFEVAANNITFKNITLQNAFLNDKEGGAINLLEDFSLTVVNCSFLHNSAKYGGAIESKGDLLIKDSTFSYNKSFFYGGAIRAMGRFKLKSSSLINNTAWYDGGAIYNQGVSVIEDCILSNNEAKIVAGAIDNWKEITISNTIIEDNKAGEASAIKNYDNLTIHNSSIRSNTKENDSVLYNDSGIVKIYQSDISQNLSKDYIIYNKDTLMITDSTILNNKSENIIFNESNLSLSGGKISDNKVKQSILCNNDSTRISKTYFKNDYINVLNNNELVLENAKIDLKSIVNNKNLINETENDIKEKIISKDFTYLESLINNSKDIIRLDDDFRIKEYEAVFYEGGIDLDVNDLVIDGQNHIIDGNDLSRIFIVTGKNITLKNIIFQNGHSYHNYDKSLNNNGGVIRSNSKSNLNISNCKFIDNLSESSGGVIDNEGYMKITNSYFSNNIAKGKEFSGGGAIYNHKKLIINDCTISNNICMGNQIYGGGGALFNNYGEIELYNSNLDENTVEEFGGAISNNQGRMEIVGSSFTKNLVKNDSDNITGGGAIFTNENTVTVKDCKLQQNHANHGGAITNWGTFFIENSVISDNSSCYNSGSIYNLGKNFFMKNSILKNNNSMDTTSIKNDLEGTMTITCSTIEENANNIDEIIDTNDDDNIIIENCDIR